MAGSSGVTPADSAGPFRQVQLIGLTPAARITEMVRRRFAVEYTLAGMDLLLHRIGWSVQVPARRAAERDEAAIAAWREETWPAVKGRRRTWAPGSVSKTSLARA
ncbi:MAG: helix-turn-helix domain-containing protein [Micromonosporaceae bacterium]